MGQKFTHTLLVFGALACNCLNFNEMLGLAFHNTSYKIFFPISVRRNGQKILGKLSQVCDLVQTHFQWDSGQGFVKAMPVL